MFRLLNSNNNSINKFVRQAGGRMSTVNSVEYSLVHTNQQPPFESGPISSDMNFMFTLLLSSPGDGRAARRMKNEWKTGSASARSRVEHDRWRVLAKKKTSADEDSGSCIICQNGTWCVTTVLLRVSKRLSYNDRHVYTVYNLPRAAT